MDYPIVTIKSKEDNFNKLPEILNGLNIKDEKLRYEATEYLRNHPNRNEIIDILEKLTTVPGMKITHENLYWIYTINRDLIQLDSPIWSDPLDYIDDIQKFPTKEEKMSINELYDEYYRLELMKGKARQCEILIPIKQNIEALLQYLMSNCVIYSYAVEDVFNCPSRKDKEYADWLSYNHEIRVIRIL